MLIIQPFDGMRISILPDQIKDIYTSTLPIARTAVSSFLICFGLLLVIFFEPPIGWWTGGDTLSSDWRPTMLASGLLVAFIIISSVPELKAMFSLTAMLALVIGLVVLILVIWLWRHRLIDRFVGWTSSAGADTL